MSNSSRAFKVLRLKYRLVLARMASPHRHAGGSYRRRNAIQGADVGPGLGLEALEPRVLLSGASANDTPDIWPLTLPTIQAGPVTAPALVSTGQPLIQVQPATANTITGTVTTLNANGTTSPAVGVTLFLDVDHTGQYDAVHDPSTVSGSGGSFTFTGVAAGSYNVDEFLPSNMTEISGSAAPATSLNFVPLADNTAGSTTPNAVSGFTPAQIRQAYGFNQVAFSSSGGPVAADGTGQTIAIVDAYNDPDIAADLATFDQQFGLPAPPNLTVVAQPGTINAPLGVWGIEESLDVEWAHAIAPGAKIVLVEAASTNNSDILSAVNYARNYPGVSVVSMSFDNAEGSSDPTTDAYFTTPANHTGVTFLASAGDTGGLVNSPGALPYVVSVGGTSLTTQNSQGTYSSESAWANGGGGVSQYEPRPTYQLGTVSADGKVTASTTNRAVPDVAFDANPNTGVAIYDSYDNPSAPWGQIGGTSLGAPAWGAIIAIVNQGRAMAGSPTLDGATQTLPALYQLPSADFHDITTGNNGFAAGAGYDLATGLGTPVANLLIPQLVNYSGQQAVLETPVTVSSGGSASTSPAFVNETINTSGDLAPVIAGASMASVSGSDWSFNITGANFGTLSSFSNNTTPDLALVDVTAGFVAGYTGSGATLNLTSWANGSIQISSLGGAYGTSPNTIAPGDKLVLTLVNPQTGLMSAPLSFTASASAPIAAVSGGGTAGQPIIDGQGTASATNDTTFGTALQGTSPTIQTYAIINDGNATLTIGTITAPTGFTLTQPGTTTLAAGASTTFTVTLPTTTAGTYSGLVSIPTNDTANNPFTFAISGVVATESYALRSLASFNGTNGQYSFGGLVVDSHGDFFGTTYAGGANGDGTVFELVAGASTVTTLASFNGTNGTNPWAGLVMDPSGNLFGTTVLGGANNEGTIFEVKAGTTSISTLASFNGTNGQSPRGGLIRDNSGNLYGTSQYGGANSSGTVFELPTGSATITTLASFNGTNGANPWSGLVIDGSGNLYGTTTLGGTLDDGAVFEVPVGSGTVSTIASFNGTNGSDPFGGSLVMDSSGDLYGTAETGGANSDGAVFEVAAGSSSITTLASFNGTNGANPEGGVFIDASGNLYGTTWSGGTNGEGTVFVLPAHTGTINTLVSFNFTQGSDARGNLIVDSNGNFFSTTGLGGPNNDGTIFELSPASKLLFAQQPTGTGVNQALSPAVTVDVTDANGDLATQDGSTVTLSIASGPGGGTIGGTTSVVAAGGVATFSNLTFSTGGTYTLTATDGSLASATSTSFTITASMGTASKLAITQQPTGATSGVTISPAVTVAVEDGSGNLVGGNTSNITFAIASGPTGATLGGTTTVAAVGGVATFSTLALTVAGTYTLTATDGSLASATSTSFTITAGTATKLVIIQPPTGAAAGATISPAVTVAVEDANGNVVTSNTSNVSLAIATGPGGATLGGTVSVAAISGVATFSTLTLTMAGAYTLKATDGSLTSATSGSFTITPGTATQLVMTQPPTGTTAGSIISPAVTIALEDANGNVVTSNTSNVTLAIATGPSGATLGGTVTVAAASGVATFSTLTLAKAGAYTLKATDGSLTSATSGSFTITPGTATQLVITQAPTGTTAGAVISPAVTIAIEDASGNVITSNTSNVILAIATGPSGASLGGTTTIAAVSGVATFSTLTLAKAGAYTLKATDGSLTSATSGSFTITPGTATQLVITQAPTGTTAGATISPAVTIAVEDANGNVVTSNTSSVTMAIATGPNGATLGGTATVAAVSGVATFSTLSLATAGAYTFKATDGSLTSVTSGSFTMTPGVATQLVITQTPTGTTAGLAISPAVTVAIEDSHGNVVTSNTSSVTFAIATGPSGATLSGTTTVAAVSGVATFSALSLPKAGTYTLKATDGSLTSTTSGSFTITPGTATQLVFTQAPTNTTSGAVISPAVTVAIEDANANIVTGNTSSVTLAIATGPGGATLSGTTTVAAVNGVATFSTLTLATAGSYTLKATDGAFPSVTSGTFTINTGTATQLVISQPPTGTSAGAVISPAVTITLEDAGGNIVTGNTSNVTLAIATGPSGATLGGTTTVAAVGGVATFSTLTLAKAGSYTLKATDGALPSITSGSFTITPGTPTQLVITQPPTGTTAGTVISPAVTISIEDANGNVVTSNTSNVTLAIATGPGGATLGGTTTVAAISGVATFSTLTLATAGAYTLKATDASLTSATSGSFTITPGTATQLVITQPPTGTTAGTVISPAVTVSVEDANGNVVTANTSSVTFAIATGPGGAALGGTTTVAAVSGVATFSTLTLNEIGAYTLKATDGALTSATSGSFNIGAGTATQLVITQPPTGATAGAVISPAVTIAIEDASGNIVTSNTSNVTLAIATGPGGATLGGTTTLAAVNGIATFSTLMLPKAGNYTLKATDGSLASATSGSFTVTPGAATQLIITQAPTGAAAGAVISPAMTVAIEDANGNVVTSNTSNVSLAIATGPGGATLGGTTSVAAVSGVATFSTLTLATAGAYTLKATDGSLASATSGSFTITPGSPTQLVMTQAPTSTTAGAAISPAVTISIEDANGNVVSSNTSNVTLAVATGPSGGMLGGTTTVAAIGGVATFSAVTLAKAGAYTLKATDGSLTSVTSGSFNISAGAPTQLVIAQAPTGTTAGTTISPAVTIDVEDASGNIVTTNTSNVTMAIATGPGGATLGGTTTVAAVGGVATFSTLTLAKAGSYTLTATDSSLTGTTSGSFAITPGTATQLVMTQAPTSATAGAAIAPAVTIAIEDANGNVVTSNTSNVTLAIATGPSGATLGGTTTVAAVGGVATFSSLTLAKAGAYTIKATDGSLTSATSGSFTITPGTTTQLVITQPPTSATAGAVISPAVTIAIEDASGNVVTSNTSNITLAIATGPGGATLGGTATIAAIGGVATFGTLTLAKAGAYTLKATDGSLTSATSGSFTITPGTATQLVITQPPTSATAGAVISPAVTIAIEDASGNVVTSNTSNVTLAIATGPGGTTLGGTTTVAAINGVATFSTLTLAKAGAYTFTATDGSLTSANSGSFTISAGTATKLVITQPPTGTTAGVAIAPAITVAIEDANGNVVTANTSSVTFAIATGPGGATLGGTTTVAAVSGVATFNNLTLATAGAYTLTASDTGLTAATSSSFSVSTAGATHVVFAQQPTNATAGATLTPSITVDVEDAESNIVSSNGSTVTLTIASGPTGGTLIGTLSVAAVSGVATFNGISLPKAGTYTLTASDGVLTPATSGSFSIAVGPAAQLAFIQQPSNATAGTPISPVISVEVEDAQGNVVTTNSSGVTIAIATGPANGAISGTATVTAAAGVATFSGLALPVAGNYTLQATDGALGAATSNSFTIAAGPAAKLAMVQPPTNTAAGTPIAPPVTIDVEDANGNLVTSNSSTVTLAINSGPTGAVLGGTLSVAATGGVATFANLSLAEVGTYTLKATDGSLSSATSSAFTVDAGVAAQLVIAQQPTTGTAGVTLSPTVTVDVEDAEGNLLAANTSNVTLAIDTGPSGGTLGGTLTVAAVGGVATFSTLSLPLAGTYTLKATDAQLTSQPTASLVINPGPASQLVFSQQPTSTTAGAAISPSVTVTLEDALGNVVSSGSTNVLLSIATGPTGGTIDGTSTVASVGGVATFSGLDLPKAGAYTLKAAGTGLASATSGSFTITPGAATQLVFAQQPSNTQAGVVIAPSVTVDIEDAEGNIVTAAVPSVALSIATGPVGGTLLGTGSVNAISGEATFDNLELPMAGSYTLRAVGTALASTSSASFNITPGPATQLVFTQQPGSTGAQTPLMPPVTLSVEDAHGNVVTTDTSSVTLAIATGPAGGTLGGTTTVAAVGGVATFSSLELPQTGVYTLRATDGSLPAATSGSFTISPGMPGQLVVAQQPANATAGAVLSPAITVDIEDSDDNLATTDDSNVTLAIATGPNGGTLLGTTTVAAVNGVATFGAVSLPKAGTYTLKAIDGALTQGTSESFTITAGQAAELVITQQPSGAAAGAVIAPPITVDVEDAEGNTVLTDQSNISVAIASGPAEGTLLGTTTVAAFNGVATFATLSLSLEGSYTLGISRSGLPSITSGSFTVGTGSPAKLAFIQQPGDVTAGSAISPAVTVQVEDAAGNPVTTDSSDVTLALATGPTGGTLAGTLTVAAVNGLATFANVTLPEAGTYTLEATDAALTLATSGGFSVTPGAAAQLVVITQPSDATSGADIAPAITIDVEDAHGNLVTTDNSSITLAIASGPNGATLVGTATVTAVNGVATFSTLSLAEAGTYTLLATDASAGVTPATTAGFTISPGAATQLVFVNQPMDTAVNAAMGSAVTVDVEDANGNLVTDDASSVTLAIASGPTGGVLNGTTTVAALNGVATFSGLSLTAAGDYTLTATDAGPPALAAATSDSFNISDVSTTSIGGISAAGPVLKGTALTLTAQDVTAAAPATVQAVYFYESTSATFTPGTAHLLGKGQFADGSDYVLNASTSSLPLGSDNFFARVLDSTGQYSSAVSTTATIQDTPPTIGQLVVRPGSPAAGQRVTITAQNVTDPLKGVSKVSFYWDPTGTGTLNGAILLGTATNSTEWALAATLPGPGASPAFPTTGSAMFLAQAIDIRGTLGAAVLVSVDVNMLPVIGSLSTTPAGSAARGTTVTYTASAVTDANDTIKYVAFYLGNPGDTTFNTSTATLLGHGTLAPGSSASNATYTLVRKLAINTALGTYPIFAVAVNSHGATGAAVIASLTVTDAPPTAKTLSVSPAAVAAANSVTLRAGGLSDPDGTVASVQYYWDPTGTGSTAQAVLLGTGTAAGNWSLSAELPSATDPNTPFPTSGTALFLAQPVDNLGVLGNIITASIPVAAQPAVAQAQLDVSPLDGQPAVTFSASGVTAATPAKVTKVQFWLGLAGTTSLDTIGDQFLGWGTNQGGGTWLLTLKSLGSIVPGNYVLFARALDSRGVWSEAAAEAVTLD